MSGKLRPVDPAVIFNGAAASADVWHALLRMMVDNRTDMAYLDIGVGKDMLAKIEVRIVSINGQPLRKPRK